MKDLRVEVRCRNNVLWHVIFDVAQSVAAFCSTHGLSQTIVGTYLNLTESPWRTYGTSPTAQRLCDIAGIDADELFPRALYGEFPRFRVAELESQQLLAPKVFPHALPSPEDACFDGERTALLRQALQTLTPREEKVLTMRFGLDGEGERTLQEVATFAGVNKERIRQIEAKALRKLRHPSRSRPLRSSAMGWR